MSAPIFVGTPDPPSDPDTPSEMPGTPNSTTTSLSALSTTAIKDGHRGSSHMSSTHPVLQSSSNLSTLEAERADRISRLAGLERVSTLRQPNYTATPGGSATQVNAGAGGQGQIPGYFDALGNPVYTTKMSTVGSASATGSMGGGESMETGDRTTTWASGSVGEDGDVMSLNTNPRDDLEREQDRFSDAGEDGMSEEGNASLVAFGEGAGSTVSGPTYTRSRPIIRSEGSVGSALGERERVARLGPVADDTASEFVDATTRSPAPSANVSAVSGSGIEAAEKIIRDRLDDGEGKRAMSTPEESGLGKFYFEDRK